MWRAFIGSDRLQGTPQGHGTSGGWRQQEDPELGAPRTHPSHIMASTTNPNSPGPGQTGHRRSSESLPCHVVDTDGFPVEVSEVKPWYSRKAAMGLLLLLLMIMLLPAAFALWFCIGIAIAGCLRAPHQSLRQGYCRQRSHTAPSSLSASHSVPQRARPSRIPDNSAWVVFHRNQPVPLDVISLQLAMLERGISPGHEGFRHVEYRQWSGATSDLREPLSETDLASLPVYAYRRPGRSKRQEGVKMQPARTQQQQKAAPSSQVASCKSSVTAKGGSTAAVGTRMHTTSPQSNDIADCVVTSACYSAQEQRQTGNTANRHPLVTSGGGHGSSAASSISNAGCKHASQISGIAPLERQTDSSATGVGSDEEAAGLRTCVVCLDPFEDGALVMTLPCMHLFHQSCVLPWLQQQGKRAVCPVCKTPCFG